VDAILQGLSGGADLGFVRGLDSLLHKIFTLTFSKADIPSLQHHSSA
jgi:hypothetical protein